MNHAGDTQSHCNNDILMRCPDDISCFFALVRFPYGVSCLLVLVPNTIFLRLSFLATVFTSSQVSTSSICGYSWQRSTASNKPSPLSSNLCACPAGTYCPSGTLAASTPVTCTEGSYCAKGSTATAPCPSGHYCSSPSSLVPCPAGVVQWHPG